MSDERVIAEPMVKYLVPRPTRLVPIKIFQNRKLSLGAIGYLAYIYTLTDDELEDYGEENPLDSFVSNTKEERDRIWEELIRYGYITHDDDVITYHLPPLRESTNDS